MTDRAATYIAPLSQTEAAEALGISTRKMADAVKRMIPGEHYDQRGAKRLFYPEQIQRLRAASWVFASKTETAGGTRTEPLQVNPFAKALALATKSKQRKLARC